MSADRMFSRRPLALLGGAGAALATLGAASRAEAQSIDDVLNRKKLVVGILVDLPPFGLVAANNQYEGYDPDVARLMAKYLGVDLELMPVAGPNRIPFLLANRVDMLIATFGITPERARQVAFSIPYSSLDVELLAPRATKITGVDDLKPMKVGVPRASAQDSILSAIAPPGTRIMRFEDDATNAQAMLSGQVDAIGAGIHIAQQIIKMNPAAHYESKLLLRHQPNGMALRRGQMDLLQWVNTFIYYVKNNGELDGLYRKWLDGPLPELPVF
jgi:polar amino acid transport system substrate-binding protein